MSTLANQQQALLAVLFDWPSENAIKNIAAYASADWARGLKVYKSNGHALAQRGLQAAYPVLAQLLGDESFAALAQAFWHASPPQRGDVAQWGAALADFVRADAQLIDTPYLADVAAVEWALHGCASAADGVVDAASFALLNEQDPLSLQLRLAPGVAVLSSAWPIVSIVVAHRDATPDLADASQRVRAGVAESAIIWRAGLRPSVREALTDEVPFMTALLSGQTLGAALTQATELDIGAWLPRAVQSGLLLGVQVATAQPAATSSTS